MNTNTETTKLEIAKILHKADALQFGLYKLTNGKLSPYYIDLRIIPSLPTAYKQICNYYTQAITQKIGLKNFDRIAGIPIAGIPFASQIAYNLQKPLIYTRKTTRLHGRQRRIEGILVSGDKVLIIDDLVTTGLTIQKAAQAITAEGGIVTQAIALLDRQEGAKQKLAKHNIQLHTLLKITDVAQALYEIGAIDTENLKTIKKQIKKT